MPSFFNFLKKAWLLIASGIFLIAFWFLNSQAPAAAVSTSFIINEVGLGSTGKTNADYIKLYNLSANPLDLKGYRLVKRAKTSANDTSIKSFTDSYIVQPGAYFTWANSDYATELGADVSTGSTLASDNCLALRQGANDTGEIIDALGWGECANLAENTPTCNPSDGAAIKRNGLNDTDNNATDFSCGNTIAPPADNTNPTPPSGGGGDSSYTPNNPIVLSELYPSPNTGEEEWLELYSIYASLDGYYLEDEGGSKMSLTGIINNYLLITNPKISLNNSGDVIMLKNSSGQIIDQISYGTKALPAPEKGQSSARDNNNSWQITSSPTPGNQNNISLAETSQAEKKTESLDKTALVLTEILANPLGPDDEPWQSEEFIELENISSSTINLKGYLITIDKKQNYLITGDLEIAAGKFLILAKKDTELSLPNSGAEIEIYNSANKKIIKQKYPSLAEGTSFAKQEIKLALDEPWLATLAPTPGAKNIITKLNTAPTAIFNCPKDAGEFLLDASDSYDLETQALKYNWQLDGQDISQKSAIYFNSDAKTHTIILTISDGILSDSQTCHLKSLGSKTLKPEQNKAKTAVQKIYKTTTKKTVAKKTASKKAAVKKTTAKKAASTKTSNLETWQGQVISLPGNFGSQYFYIEDSEGLAKQIYSYKKLFPKLKLGDIITASGVASSGSDYTRLKTKEASDIKITNHKNLNKLDSTPLADMDENLISQRIQISGIITNKRASNIFIDDGQAEATILLPKNTKLNIQKGDSLTATGLVRANSSGLVLAVATPEDLQIAKISSSSAAQTSSTLNEIPAKPATNLNVIYITIVIFCLTAGLLIAKNIKK